MKAKKLTLVTVAIALSVALAQHSAVAKKGGTSILHFMVRTEMTSTGFDPGAQGSINGKRNQQGHADNQRLEIVAANLQSNTTYFLLASTLDHLSPTNVDEFVTDGNGAADIKYVKLGQGNASPGGDPLPSGLDPISKIRALAVSIGGTQDVLTADLTGPDKLQYLIKRAMTNDGVDADAAAALRIKATQSFVQFRIRASGLDPTSTCYLAINGSIAETEMSDASGDLNIESLPGGAPDVLDITGLAVLNSASNSVLSTTLP